MKFMSTIDELVSIDNNTLSNILASYSEYVMTFYETHDKSSTPVSLLEYVNNDYNTSSQLSFLDDTGKMIDYLVMTKEEFLKCYSYITIDEYVVTDEEFKEDIAYNLADMMREAENIYIEELNGRSESDLTSLEIKNAVSEYLPNLTKEERIDFEEYCRAMAV